MKTWKVPIETPYPIMCVMWSSIREDYTTHIKWRWSLKQKYVRIFWIYRLFYVVVVSEESITRFDRCQLTWPSFDVSQGSAPLKSTQEILSARDPVSGGNTIPTDFISSKWKPWDFLQRTIQYCKQTAQYHMCIYHSLFWGQVLNSVLVSVFTQ